MGDPLEPRSSWKPLALFAATCVVFLGIAVVLMETKPPEPPGPAAATSQAPPAVSPEAGPEPVREAEPKPVPEAEPKPVREPEPTPIREPKPVPEEPPAKPALDPQKLREAALAAIAGDERPPLLAAAARLADGSQGDPDWDVFLGLAQAVLDAAGEAPFSLPNLGRYQALPKGRSSHERIMRCRFAGPPADPDERAADAAAALTGDVKFEIYVRNAVVVVSGDLETPSYINDSLVVVGGAVRCGSHIRNSLVIALGGPIEGGSYATDSLLMAPSVSVDDVRASARAEQKSGDALRAWLKTLGKPAPLEAATDER